MIIASYDKSHQLYSMKKGVNKNFTQIDIKLLQCIEFIQKILLAYLTLQSQILFARSKPLKISLLRRGST